MSLRTPLGRVLGLGTAKDGTDHWWAQRVSAVALILLGGWFMFQMATMESFRYFEAMTFVADPWNSVLLSLLCVPLAYHSYLGVQVVLEDYVHDKGLKVLSLLASRFAHVLVAIVAVYAILRVGIGS